MTDWQTIESAPKDGSDVWLWDARHFPKPKLGHWFSLKERWLVYAGDTFLLTSPTHWLPVPPPPKFEKKADDEIERLRKKIKSITRTKRERLFGRL